MNKIEFIKEKIPFTQVANGVLTDSRLSAKAKGLYAYLYSKPDGWDFAVSRITLEMADGKASISEGLQELETFGFLTRKRQADGRVIYMVHFPPINPITENQQMVEEPLSEKATMGKSHSGKIGQVSNKDSLVIKNTSNKDSGDENAALISRIIELFSEINPACKNMYGNKTQRLACKNLVDTYGFEEVKNCIQNVLPRTNGQIYFPVITTPIQLRDKWISLKSAVAKKRNNTVEIIN